MFLLAILLLGVCSEEVHRRMFITSLLISENNWKRQYPEAGEWSLPESTPKDRRPSDVTSREGSSWGTWSLKGWKGWRRERQEASPEMRGAQNPGAHSHCHPEGGPGSRTLTKARGTPFVRHCSPAGSTARSRRRGFSLPPTHGSCYCPPWVDLTRSEWECSLCAPHPEFSSQHRWS